MWLAACLCVCVCCVVKSMLVVMHSCGANVLAIDVCLVCDACLCCG